MVTVFLRGGLGNQMFQYAAGLNLAKKNNTDLLLDTVSLRDRFPRRKFTYRDYDLGIFIIKPTFTFLSELANALPIPGVWLGLDLLGTNVRRAFGLQALVKRSDDLFDPRVLETRGNIFLYGRWQNEHYFKDIEQEVRSAFTFREPLQGEARLLAQEIEKTNSISLHVRRGDYATFASVYTGETNLAYYETAVNYLTGRIEKPHFFVFSDDIDWCKENIKLAAPVTYVKKEIAGPRAAFHLDLMSRCKHHIIANSTFSWWGAWLDSRMEKIVIAPKQWYIDPKYKEEIVPPGWIKL